MMNTPDHELSICSPESDTNNILCRMLAIVEVELE